MNDRRTERTGVAIAGNLLVDLVKDIAHYPEKGSLADITATSRAVGGCANNTSIDLIKIDPALPVSAIGCVGEDEYGQYILSMLRQHGVNTDGITVTDKHATSFTDVMSLQGGERTFFTYRGANAHFGPEHVDVAALTCRMLHIGYILLLDKFDSADAEYGTVMARFLHDIRDRGIKTSIDVVTKSGADYQKVIPALKYTDYAILNEIECCSIWGESPRFPDGRLDVATIRHAMQRMLDAGVREKVIVHSKEAGFCLSADGSFTKVGSLKLDNALFKGSVGAGDAFCAGCLYSLYHGVSDRDMLEFASAAAACNLFAANSIDGMRHKDEIKKLKDTCDRIEI